MQVLPIDAGRSRQAAELAREAIQQTEGTHYSKEQVAIWRSRLTDARCAEILSTTTGIGAFKGNQLIGFATLSPQKSEIEFLYVSSSAWGKGVGRALIDAIEAEAARLRLSELRVDASLLASPMLARLGYSIERENPKTIDGVNFSNAWMLKRLP